MVFIELVEVMTSYVLLYHFGEEKNKKQFEQGILKLFPRHKKEVDNNFEYFGFAAEAESGVEGKIDGILNSMGYGSHGYFGKTEYVALYFSREADPDNIKRKLLVGTEDMVNKNAESMPGDAHRDTIQNLLEFDYRKIQV